MASLVLKNWISDARVRRLIPLMAVSGLAIFFGLVSARLGGATAVALLALIVFLPMVVSRPFFLMVAIILASFSLDYLQSILNLPRFVTWIQSAMIVILFILALAHRTPGQEKRPTAWPVVVATMAMFGILLFSTVLNGSDLEVAFAALKNYFTYPLLFLAAISLDLTEKQRRLTGKLMVALILMQLPIVLLQRYSVLPGAAAATSGIEDFAGGTLGSNATGILSLLCIGLTGIALNLIVFDRMRLNYLIIIVLSIIPPCVAEGKIVIILLPIVVLVVLGLKSILTTKGSWRRTLLAILAGTGLMGTVIYLMPMLAPETTLGDILSSRDAFWLYLTQAGGDPLQAKFGRATDIGASFGLISQHLQSFLLGFGPGATSATGQAFLVYSPFAFYLNKGIGGNQLSAMMLEVGLLGITAYFLLLLILAVPILRSAYAALDRSQALYTTSFIVVFFVYLVGLVYSEPWWSSALSVCFWVFGGLAWLSAPQRGLDEHPRQASC